MRVLVPTIILLCAALSIVLWWGWEQREARMQAQAEARLYADQIAQARVAEGVARVELELERERAAALSAAVIEINGGPDAPLPDHIRAVLDGLRTD